MTVTFKGTTFALVAASAAILVTGCTNMDIRPADQGPRAYTVAHDSTEGDNCRRTKAHSYVGETKRTERHGAVRCLNIQEIAGEPTPAPAPVRVIRR